MKTKTNKNKINLIIDVIMIVVIMIVTGLGLLIKYVLVAGFKSHEIYGKGVDLSFLGYDRHQWGSIHLIFSIILIILIILHIVLHWKMITTIFKQMVVNKSKRRIIGSILALISIVLAMGPLFISPDVCESTGRNKQVYTMKQQGKFQNLNTVESLSLKKNDSINIENYQHIKQTHLEDSDIELFGYMTIYEVSEKHNISTKYLKVNLGIPESISNNSKLGQLRKRYNFSMGDVKKIIKDKGRFIGENYQ